MGRWRVGITTVLILVWVALFAATHWPQPPQLPSQVTDKLVHFVAYASLGFLLGITVATWKRLTFRRVLWLAVGLAIYGVLDELLQIPVNRHADVADWFADISGATCGLLAAWLCCRGLVRTN